MSGALVAFGRTEKTVYAAGEPVGTAVLDATAGCWTFEPSPPGAWSAALAASSWDSLAELGSDVALAAPDRAALDARAAWPDAAETLNALARLVDAVDAYVGARRMHPSEAEMRDEAEERVRMIAEGEAAEALLARSRDASMAGGAT